MFTGRFASDGLATDKLARLELPGNKLRLGYAVEYGRYASDYRYRQFPPGQFDPASGGVQPGGPARVFDDNQFPESAKPPAAERQSPLPWLGGVVLRERTFGGKRYLCGTHGLVIVDGGRVEEPPLAEIAVALTVDPENRLLDEVRQTKVTVADGKELERWLQSANPLLRAQALAAIWPKVQTPEASRQYVELAARCLDDAHPRVRSTALFLLSQVKDDAAVPALRRALADRDPHLRAVATLALIRHGQLPPIGRLEEILASEYGNLPFGADSTVGVQVGRQQAWEAVAPLATPEIVRVLLQQPPSLGDHDNRTKVFPQLGRGRGAAAGNRAAALGRARRRAFRPLALRIRPARARRGGPPRAAGAVPGVGEQGPRRPFQRGPRLRRDRRSGGHPALASRVGLGERAVAGVDRVGPG